VLVLLWDTGVLNGTNPVYDRTLSIPEPPANITETATLTALNAAINT